MSTATLIDIAIVQNVRLTLSVQVKFEIVRSNQVCFVMMLNVCSFLIRQLTENNNSLIKWTVLLRKRYYLIVVLVMTGNPQHGLKHVIVPHA